jgi:hypothetical protein
MYSHPTVIVTGSDMASDHNPIHIHPEDSKGHRLTAVRLGSTTIQTASEVSPLDLAALFDRWAEAIRSLVGAPQDGVVVAPWQAPDSALVEADFTPSGGAA